MQLGEPLMPGVLIDPAHDDECYFCKNKEEPRNETNDLTDNPDEDAAELEDSLGTYRFHNDAGKLGTALGGKPEAKQVLLGGAAYDAAVAAHHLIPGNAALKNSSIMKHLKVDGAAAGNIAYNVNSSPNGVWLVGNYGVRPWGSGGSSFSGLPQHTPKDFVYRAMEAWRGQFHDAHEAYSDFVREDLDELADKIKLQKKLWCPEAKDKKDEDDKPLYSLVARLNTVSGRLRRLLVFPTKNWKANVYTSSWVLQYVSERPHQV